jgi:hypothetical protein
MEARIMETTETAIANIIQIAITPVFLLVGIAGFLNVLSQRLGRIVDRARVLEVRVPKLDDSVRLGLAQSELRTLWRRVRIINWSIALCTLSALMVCALVVDLFVGQVWKSSPYELVAGMFVIALLLLIAALVLFLREVQLATRVLQMGQEV